MRWISFIRSSSRFAYLYIWQFPTYSLLVPSRNLCSILPTRLRGKWSLLPADCTCSKSLADPDHPKFHALSHAVQGTTACLGINVWLAHSACQVSVRCALADRFLLRPRCSGLRFSTRIYLELWQEQLRQSESPSRYGTFLIPHGFQVYELDSECGACQSQILVCQSQKDCSICRFRSTGAISPVFEFVSQFHAACKNHPI